MPAYALHTDPAAFGSPARYAVLRYPSERARAAARVYNTGFIEWAYTRYADADAALYFN